MSKAISQYLSRYAENESTQLLESIKVHQYALVIPFYRESYSALKRFINFVSHKNVLLVIVLNNPESDNNIQWAEDIIACLNPALWQNNNLALYKNYSSQILLIDRFSKYNRIPDKQGVGLARKIGADIACKLIANQTIVSPWIFTTDADAHLPENYFQTVNAVDTNKYCAITCKFKHQWFSNKSNNSSIDSATLIYERSLHQYVDGLRFAGSPYAFHTIGSTLIINYKHYAQARGFPKKSAGEDFYLLNKLAKLGRIYQAKTTIILESRLSDRTSFGTGVAVKKICDKQLLTYRDYHQNCFIALQYWLNYLEKIADNGHYLPINIEYKLIEDHLIQYCDDSNFEELLDKCFKQCSNYSSRKKYLNEWFDGFKTLKFIHYMNRQFCE